MEISLSRCGFPILGVDFLRAHKLLIDPVDNALLDSTGRRLAGQLLRSPPTATVVVGFVQPHKPVAGTSSLLRAFTIFVDIPFSLGTTLTFLISKGAKDNFLVANKEILFVINAGTLL